MLEFIKNWKGQIEIDGKLYNSVAEVANFDFDARKDVISIKLLHKYENTLKTSIKSVTDDFKSTVKQYRITVKAYMTKEASPEFDFMMKWNNNKPMPLRTMIGTIEKETRGMVYMKLHGDIYAKKICTCMKCGRTLTNSISQFFGIGPECGGHNYVNPFNTDAELQEAVKQYRAQLQNIVWEGWVIKSAIIEQEEYYGND